MSDPRAGRRTRRQGYSPLPRTLRLYQSQLRFVSSAHATLPRTALAGLARCARTRGDRMGETGQAQRVPHAPGRRAAGGLVARLSLTLQRLGADRSGATAIEYGLIVAFIFL